MSDIKAEEKKLRSAFGSRIAGLREKRDWSQAELARRIGVARTQLLRWEKGAMPPLTKLILLSTVLETTLDVLIAGRPVEHRPAAGLTPDQRRAAAKSLNDLAGLLQLRPQK